jgi:hypothetical protein
MPLYPTPFSILLDKMRRALMGSLNAFRRVEKSLWTILAIFLPIQVM